MCVIRSLNIGLSNRPKPAAQQVADMLRERLDTLGSDLLDARARASELEGVQSADREIIRTTNDNLCRSGKSISNEGVDFF